MGGKDPGVYMNEGVQLAQRGALVIDDPIVAGVPSRVPRPLLPPAQPADLLQHAVHGLLHPEPGPRRGRRPISASLPRVDCDWLRAGRPHRRATNGQRLGRARPDRGVSRRCAPDRAARRRGQRRAPRHQRRRSLVRPLSERRNGHAGADVCRDARVRARAGWGIPLLRTLGGCPRRPSAVPAVRRDSGCRDVRRRRHAGAVCRTSGGLGLRSDARGDGRGRLLVSREADGRLFGGIHRLYAG